MSYMIRFNEHWLNDQDLRDWIVRVINDESRVYCRYCQIVLRAHKADLTTHSNTAKHKKNAENGSVSGACTGPITVQIISTDEDQNQIGQSQQNTILDLDNGDGSIISDSSSINNISTTVSSVRQKIEKKVIKDRIQYTKKFRPEWEQHEELKGWVCQSPNDSTRAYCKVCEVALRAHKHDLLLHGRSTKHKRGIECGGGIDNLIATINYVDQGETEKILEEPSILEEDFSNKIVKEEDMIDIIEHETNKIIIPNSLPNSVHHEITNTSITIPNGSTSTNCQFNQEFTQELGSIQEAMTMANHEINVENKTKLNVVPNKISWNNKAKGGGRSRKRKITLAEVIDAIEKDEFKGYELLQIVKSAVPRL